MKLKTTLKYPLLLSTFLLSASAVQAADLKLTHKKQMTLSRIIDGVATRAGERPWMASLQQGGEHFCGGSVIDRQWILTAAHCIEDITQGDSNFKVRVNFTNLSDTSSGETHQVETIYAHEGYAKGESKDIALLKLKTPISGSIAAVALANKNTMLEAAKPGQQASVSGWGNTSTTGEEFPQELRNVEVPIVSNEVCNSAEAYGGQIKNTEMCAGFAKGGKDSCQGDSGGPLVVRENGEFVQAGVVSWGDGCAQPNKYGVYARVASFTDWIADVKAGKVKPGTGGGNGGNTGGGDDGGDWGDGDWGDIPQDGTLISGLPFAGISGDTNSTQMFQIEVEEGARILWVDIKGLSGDADLYLQQGSEPTTEAYEYAPMFEGSNEHVMVEFPESGTWYIMVHGHEKFEDLEILAFTR